jgi:hypothetical protein
MFRRDLAGIGPVKVSAPGSGEQCGPVLSLARPAIKGAPHELVKSCGRPIVLARYNLLTDPNGERNRRVAKHLGILISQFGENSRCLLVTLDRTFGPPRIGNALHFAVV